MITYIEFKEMFDSISVERFEPEITIYFKNRIEDYMIIKYSDYITFQRCGLEEERSGEIRYESLDELYHIETIDGIVLKNEWMNIEDILFDDTFSVAWDDMAEFYYQYGIQV